MCSISVSVIIPVYNGERHLEECLNSCLEQTLEGMEIICINDGSTDSTGEILERYAGQYPQLVVLHQENQGAGSARNLGIAQAQGEFVAFMDADDYYPDKDVLKKLYDAALREGVLVCGGSMVFLSDGKVNQNDGKYRFEDHGTMSYREYQKAGCYVTFLYNTVFLRESRITFPDHRRFQDPPFFVAVMTQADKFYAMRDAVYVCRKTDKLINYHNPDIVMGILNGVKDILCISRKHQFEKLHTDMVIRLRDEYIACAWKLIYNQNNKVRECYEKVLAEIDETLLTQDDRMIRKPELLSDDEICRIVNNSLERERVLLDKVNTFDMVLIYGAGAAGRKLYHYFLQRKCNAHIEFMVSVKDPAYTAHGKPIKSICEYDHKKETAFVIIANRDHAEQMEETARRYQFKHIETVSYHELMLFGADMMEEGRLITFSS